MKNVLLLSALAATTLLVSCGGGKQMHSTGINTQTQRVETKLKRSDYTLLDKQFTAQIVNKKKFKKYSLDQLKEAAFMQAEAQAIRSGADGVLNPVFAVEQKGKRFYVEARVKAYKLKSDNDYLDMENSLKHNPNS